jgi:hypothetical protein
MHVQPSLLNGKTDARPCKSEVLKSSNQTAIFHGRVKRFAIGYGQLGIHGSRCEARIAV